MTREEAIRRLEMHIAYHRYSGHGFKKTNEAMETAIAALREQLTTNCHQLEPVTNRNGLNRTESDTVKVVDSDQFATNLQPEASNQQITESLQRNGSGGSEEAPASKNQVKGIRLMARPWQPQDLLDDLQLMIDEEPDRYLNDRRTTMCMARDFLKEHFAESGWISVKDRLPKEWKEKGGDLINYLVFMPEYGVDVGNYAKPVKTWLCMGVPCKVTHWMPLPEPPEVEV